LPPQPQLAGGSESPAQSHWVSSPGGCPVTATARSFSGWQGSQCGRRSRARSCRVNVGYDRSYPSPVTSSNRAVAHRCGSSARRAAQYAANGPNGSATAQVRTPASRSPRR
jgi:hypothetical protein